MASRAWQHEPVSSPARSSPFQPKNEAMKKLELREWLRHSQSSESGLFVYLEHEEGEKSDGAPWSIYSGNLTLRDCHRSASMELSNHHDDDLEGLVAIREYADKAIRWIEKWKKQHGASHDASS